MLAAIVVDTCAFMLWNLASRSPARLARDVADGLKRAPSAASGIARAIGGLLLLAAGSALLVPLAIGYKTYIILEIWAVLTGLLVEQLIGADLRARRERS